MQEFFFFAGGNGGGAILDVADEAALTEIMVNWPLAPFSDVDAILLTDGDRALQIWQEALSRQMDQMGQGHGE